MRIARGWLWRCAGLAGSVLAVACSSGNPVSQPVAQSSAAVTSTATPTISTFVVYAAQSVTLGTSDRSIGGDIGVGGTSGTSPQLAVGGQDTLDAAHTLVAPAISVGSHAIVGAVETNALANNGGQVGAESPYPSSMPPLPAVFAATPGTTAVTVAQGQQQTLSPGNYGALTDDGVVFLNPGTYSFASVTLGNSAQLQALRGGSTSVLVAGALATGTQAQIFPVGQPAAALTVSVSGSDGTGGAPPAVSIGGNSQVTALLAAPNGSLSFGNNVQATGAFAGANFLAGSNATLNFQSGFANAVPSITTFVAYAGASMTLGTALQSSGGDIGVAGAASSSGAQLTVGNNDVIDSSHVLYGPSVSLGLHALVGDVDTNALTNNGGSFGSEEPYPGQG